MLSSTHQGRSHAQSSDPRKPKAIKSSAAGWIAVSIQAALVTGSVAILTLAVFLGWHYQHVRTNVAWLDRHHATYEWHYKVPHLERLTWQKFQSKLAPVVGQAIVSDIHTVSINEPSLSDEELASLSKLRSLSQLTLSTDGATDETLARIAELKQLRSLTISGDQFSFGGLLSLRKLPRLRYLNLSNMHLSMAELAVLESAVPLANLKYNKAGMVQPYERQVVGRYPKLQASERSAEVGFEPLIKMDKTTKEGLPVSTVADEPEMVHAS